MREDCVGFCHFGLADEAFSGLIVPATVVLYNFEHNQLFNDVIWEELAVYRPRQMISVVTV